MRRMWWVVVVTVAAGACGGSETAPGPAVAGDATASFPDPDRLPAISTTTTGGAASVPAARGGAMGTPTTFAGLPPGARRTTTTAAAGTSAPAAAHGVWRASLSGSEIVPPPGDPRGSGSATLRAVDGQLCFELQVRSLFAEPTAAHVHRGPRGAAGDTVATLAAPENDGTSSGCVAVEPAVLDALAADPSRFYVDVHSGTHPDGAIRGQLTAA